MSNLVELKLPKLGESIQEATVVQWLKKEGDWVEADESLLEVATAKVNSEIPSTVSGVLEKIIVRENQTVEVGAVLALLNCGAKCANGEAQPTGLATKPESSSQPGDESNVFFSPALLRVAKENQLSLEELQSIPGTGLEGRVTIKDLQNYLANKATHGRKSSEADRQVVKMTSMRKAIADNMVKSFYTAPHASLVMEVDFSEILEEIKKQREAFQEKHGVKLTVTSFAVQAIAKAVTKFPLVNSTLKGDEIILRQTVNLGLAVNIKDGLMVPVVRDAAKKELVEIAKTVSVLTEKARQERLLPADLEEGTITFTNFGMSEALIGMPILRYPEVAIIGMGAIKKRAIVSENETMQIRHMAYLTLTFDHRVIDGMYGCAFLGEVKALLERKP